MAKRRSSIYRSLLTFFGLTPEDRPDIFTMIHEIVYHGNGGYDWQTVYEMPIWLRLFTYNKIKDFIEKRAEEQDKAMKESQGIQELNYSNQQITPPDYIAKAPRN